MPEILISVLMTSFNREQYIAEAIESVLASTYKNFELIIVDDRSTDQTLSIARRYEALDGRIKVYLNKINLGDYPNRNRAASYASGKYLKFLDSDDTIFKEGLEYCVRAMENFPESAFGISMLDGIQTPEALLMAGDEVLRKQYFDSNHLTAGPTGMIIKRSVFETIKGFDTRFNMANDFYFNVNVALLGPVVLLKTPYFFYRMHETQEQNNPIGYLIYGYLANKELLERAPLPFDQKEIQTLERKMNRQHARSMVKLFVRHRAVKDSLLIMRKTQFSFAKLLRHLFIEI